MPKKKNHHPLSIEDFSLKKGQLLDIDANNLIENEILAPTIDAKNASRAWRPITEETRKKTECGLDNTIALSIPKPRSEEEKTILVKRFLDGLAKLFSKTDNWAFLKPLMLSVEGCARCRTCSESCHIYWASGKSPLYEPLFRSEILRRLYFRYIKAGNHWIKNWRHGNLDFNWEALVRLAELSYRCNLCRRCAQTCPLSLDNGLLAHELRKIFSQELNIAPRELHEQGAMLQLKTGSSTGMTPPVVKDNVDFIDDDTSEKTGLKIKTPWDKKGADILLLHNAGEIMAWPENHGAFATILTAAGVNWTMSSEAEEALGYDAINYGLWYDDIMLAKVAIKHARAAKNLGVKRIVLGECGHAHKALAVISDRLLLGELNIPRESAITLLSSLVFSGKLKFDETRNDFPVTLHDPCNMVRLMGIVEPQRQILREICPKFREMTPHGVDNYCCGGGSGFAIMGGQNFEDFKMRVSGRKKLEQILSVFDVRQENSEFRYVCAPCSNCKGQIRDLISYFELWERYQISYGGLAELIVNAMAQVKPGYIEKEKH